MKARSCILVMIITLIVMTNTFAQLTGGGTGGESQSVKSKPNKKSGDETNWMAVHLGLSNPIGKFKENNLNVPFNEAVGAMPGIYVAFDANTYLNATINNPLKVAISQSLAASMNGVNWQDWVPGTTSFSGEPFIFAEYKLGVLGTYEIATDMFVDGFFRFSLNCGLTAGEGSWFTGDDIWYPAETFRTFEDIPPFNVGANFGGNIRFKKLFGTLALNMGKLKWDYYLTSSNEETNYKIPISTVRLGIGMRIR